MQTSHYVLPLLLIGFCDAYIITANGSTQAEIHEFHWASGPDLSNTACAVPIVPPRHPNTTFEIELWSGQPNYIYYGASSEEDRKVVCRSLDSLFRLVGNPGIVWHPLSNQCVHTKPYRRTAESERMNHADTVRNVTGLTTSYDCNPDHPNLAYFKYDKNKPQRLSYLGPVDEKIGTREEWCICDSNDSTIHVRPACYPHEFIHETFYHEFL